MEEELISSLIIISLELRMILCISLTGIVFLIIFLALLTNQYQRNNRIFTFNLYEIIYLLNILLI